MIAKDRNGRVVVVGDEVLIGKEWQPVTDIDASAIYSDRALLIRKNRLGHLYGIFAEVAETRPTQREQVGPDGVRHAPSDTPAKARAAWCEPAKAEAITLTCSCERMYNQGRFAGYATAWRCDIHGQAPEAKAKREAYNLVNPGFGLPIDRAPVPTYDELLAKVKRQLKEMTASATLALPDFGSNIRVDATALTPEAARKLADSVAKDMGVSVPADLSPLRDLATACEWGLALDAALTRWREWHPDARVTWDLAENGGIRFLMLDFSVRGIGSVLTDRIEPTYDLPGAVRRSVADAITAASAEMAKRWRAPR